MFEVLIWGGAAVSVLGLTGLIWCIIRVARARRAGLDDQQLRDAVTAVLPYNMGALFLSLIGLMLVIVGVILS